MSKSKAQVVAEQTELANKVLALVKKWQPRMQIPEWDIFIETGCNCAPVNGMSISWERSYLRAVIHLGWELPQEEPEFEFIVVHELAHLVTAELTSMSMRFSAALKKMVGTVAYKEIDSTLHQHKEEATERIARMVWDAYPAKRRKEQGQ